MATRKPRATNSNGNGKTSITENLIEIPANINTAFANILADEPDLTFEEACKVSGCLTPYELQEYLDLLLPELDVWGLKTIPACFKPQLEEIARSVEARNSVRKLASVSESPEASESPVEVPPMTLKDMLVNLPNELQPEPSAIASTDPTELAQGHAEQEAETVELEALAEELAIGGKLEAIQAGIQDADTLAADYESAFRQRLALRKAEMWAKFGQQQTQARMSATNSNLTSPNKAIELRQKLEQQKADFLKKDQAIKTAWENRQKPSQPNN